ncbi:MAG: NAD(P)H-dependent glycerol-3-phosphate dehydrogenase, partial [Actinomycetota bacterium]|nr:NAD(P)H-dependent glycerol-3-phosphate dehydrogenase [Actinomycetota bacterium]
MNSKSATRKISSNGESIAIVGAGSWGTTLSLALAERFDDVLLIARREKISRKINELHLNEEYLGKVTLPNNVFSSTSLEAVKFSSAILIAVPSSGMRDVASMLFKLEWRERKMPQVLIATKGFERHTGLLAIEVFEEVACSSAYPMSGEPLVISGPCLSNEICGGFPTLAVIAGQKKDSVDLWRERLSSRLLGFMSLYDPLGVQCAGALKNVYAIGCGIAVGVGFGANATGLIVSRGLEETRLFIEAIGGDSRVIWTPAGVGDFVATCVSPKSRNHAFGRAIASGGALEARKGVAEGASSAFEVVNRARSLGLHLPLAERVADVVDGRESISSFIAAVLSPPCPKVFTRTKRRLACGTSLCWDF